jgi:superfamily I DNA/RNA helicase
METLTAWLTGAGVPASFLLADQSAGTVRLSTIHSAKGLDATSVLLFAGHDLEARGDEEARRLLYIAMTRAREELCVSSYADSPLIEELREKIG